MPFAAALSEHPLPTHATGEVVGQVLERLGEGAPDLAILFVTGAHGGALEDIGATVRAALDPGTLLGVTAVSVAGGDREVEERPAVALWAGRLPASRPPRPVRLTGRAASWHGLPPDTDPEQDLLLVNRARSYSQHEGGFAIGGAVAITNADFTTRTVSESIRADGTGGDQWWRAVDRSCWPS